MGTISIAGFTLLGLTKMFIHYFKKKTSIPDGYKPIIFAADELILENFEEILKKHTVRFNNSRIIEEILPREFTEESQLAKISNNFTYAKGNQDLLSLTKVTMNSLNFSVVIL
jgi:hypothetical protein